MKLRYFLFLTLIANFNMRCDNLQPDSLKLKLNTSIDTVKFKILFELAQFYSYNQNDSALKYLEQYEALCQKLNDENKIATALNFKGNVYLELGNYTRALESYINSENYFKTQNNRKGIIMVNNNIGLVYELQNLPQKALEQYESTYKAAKEINYKEEMANSLNHLGSLSYSQGEKEKALNYFKDALKLNIETKSSDRIIECYNNIAVIYQEMGQYNEALNYFNQYLTYARKSNDVKSQAIAYHNIALVYMDQKIYISAMNNLDRSIDLAKKIGDYEDLIEIYSTYTELFTKQNNYDKAFEYVQLKASAKDSVFKQERDKQFVEMSTKYQTEKKEAENKYLKVQSEKQRTITLAISIGLFLVAALAFFIFRSYRIKQKANILLAAQNIEIKEQKHIIEEKQKEILDSINYAQRLQQAILPPENLISNYFPNSFIFYKPKDIVAGDFYWMEVKNDLVFLAAADCTGHGVPGAMVSVVCSTALSRVVKEFEIYEPGKILDKTREIVLETFEKAEKDVKDGMDISLISFNTKTGEIKWAGAYNRLWYTKQNNIIEISANKQPIGRTEEELPFTTYAISLSKGDNFYLFTDGYPDQFGGPQYKKLKYKPFRELLNSSNHLSISEQKFAVEKLFYDWKGAHEQIDDVCVIGVKI